MSNNNFDIDRFFEEAINELSSKTADEFEISFAESNYYPVKKGLNSFEILDYKSVEFAFVYSDALSSHYECANDDQELSLAA